jgi:hypothetical protein
MLGLPNTFSKNSCISVENGKPKINIGTLKMCNTDLQE